MQLGLIHISDLHIVEEKFVCKAKQIASSLRALPKIPEKIILIFSGDITFSGKKKQFVLAEQLIESLKKEIKAITNSEPHCIVVPGNHDCEFPEDQGVRNVVLKEICLNHSMPKSLKIIEQCVNLQDNFFNFANKISQTPIVKGRDRMFWKILVPITDNINVSFLCLNTAWMSEIHEQQGKLFYPTEMIQTEESPSLVIGLMHHPYNWFSANNSKEIRRSLETSCDLILSGHEHDPETSIRRLPSNVETDYIEGAVYQESKDSTQSSFIVALLDYKERTYTTCIANWKDEQYQLQIGEEQITKRFLRLERQINPQVELTEDFQSFLDDPGMNLTHPNAEVTFDDIYTPPNMRSQQLKVDVKRPLRNVIKTKNVFDVLFKQKKALIYGAESSGKTAIAKALFREALKKEVYPIYLDAKRLNSSIPKAIFNFIETHITQQYKTPNCSKIIQSSSDLLVCIIDDLQGCGLNLSGKTQLLEYLQKRFETIFLISGNKAILEEAIADKNIEKTWSHYKNYDILELGHLQRRNLIEKWMKLGIEHTTNSELLETRILETEKIINTVLGKNILPAIPLFILTILQQIEAKNPVSTANGAYGYYYQTLVDFALHKTSLGNPEEVNTKITFLSELAWFFLVNKIRYIDQASMNNLLSAHWTKFRLPGNYEKFLDSLLKSKLLRYENHQYIFPYKYLFYFFCAKYMQGNLQEEDVTSQIDIAVESLHREESANILIFLTYLSRDNRLIHKILEASKRIYKDVSPCDLDKDVEFIGKVGIMAPRLFIHDTNHTHNQKSILEKKEHAETQETPGERDAKRLETERKLESNKDLKELHEVNRAYKASQILGQILRNFHGSLTGELKEELAKECAAVVLRSLKTYFQILERHFEAVVAYLAELFEKKLSEMPKTSQLNFARQVLFLFAELACLRAIKSIAYSIGSTQLTLTYNDLERAAVFPLSQRFALLSVRLEHFSAFPENDIQTILKAVQKNILGKTLLQMLVAEHFHYHYRRFDIKQKICKLLEIEVTQGMIKGKK